MMKCLVQYCGEDFVAATMFLARRIAFRVRLRQYPFWINLSSGLLVGFAMMWIWNAFGPSRSADRLIIEACLLASFVIGLAREPLTLLLWRKGVQKL
jgi:4-hydroxybenzoate polyprenyltransferase